MRGWAVLVVAVCVAGHAVPAMAEDADRYQLERMGDRLVRMDRQTGEMSTCTESAGGLVCRLAADERRAYSDEVERLQASVKALEERVVKLEGSIAQSLEKALPTEQEVRQGLDTMELFFRRFMGIVKDLEEEAPKAPPLPGNPQKT